jgi:2-oxoglutarate ferredoxin oxidoreductase subunit beta
VEPSFNISGLAQAAGASFVARSTVYDALRLDKLIERAIRKKGFSVVEVFTPCPTAFGRRNKMGTGADMIQLLKQESISSQKAAKLSDEELEHKVVTGVFVDIDKPEYTEEYEKLRNSYKK